MSSHQKESLLLAGPLCCLVEHVFAICCRFEICQDHKRGQNVWKRLVELYAAATAILEAFAAQTQGDFKTRAQLRIPALEAASVWARTLQAAGTLEEQVLDDVIAFSTGCFISWTALCCSQTSSGLTRRRAD